VPPTWKPSSRGDTATATTTNPPAPAERSYLSSALRRAHASHRAVPGAQAPAGATSGRPRQPAPTPASSMAQCVHVGWNHLPGGGPRGT
jgi:hypothetical protein